MSRFALALNVAALNIAALLIAAPLFGADPTFLRRSLAEAQPQSDDLTANARSASYKPLFGAGDTQASQLKGIARYGELTVEPGGASALVPSPAPGLSLADNSHQSRQRKGEHGKNLND